MITFNVEISLDTNSITEAIRALERDVNNIEGILGSTILSYIDHDGREYYPHVVPSSDEFSYPIMENPNVNV